MKRSMPIARMARAAGLLVVAACLWLPCLHLVFRRDLGHYRAATGLPEVARKLATTYLDVWRDPPARERELAAMRRLNPEWDFMSRTYMVLALANVALRDPGYRADALAIMDAIIAGTLARERAEGQTHFLLPYANRATWVVSPPRSLFVDGEIALMMAARRFVEENPAYQSPLSERVETMVQRMSRSPVWCAESYPDECWLFCNTLALAAVRLGDVLDGRDHSKFLAAWVATARAKLTEPRTGLLISAFSVDGTPAPCAAGPEGSSLWMAAHLLQVVDPQFAADQYQRARRELGRRVLGFGYSREWPRGLVGTVDIDSGPVIPFLGASPSASGLAVLAASAFGDVDYLSSLLTSLEAAGFPSERESHLRFLASNQVGDAVLLYALTEGPLWQEVQRRARR